MANAWKDKVAVVTGASSGIGAATAKKLAREGLRVVVSARRLDRLQTLAEDIRRAGGSAHILPADLSKEDERKRLLEEVEDRFANADVLVNNAGLGWYGYASEMPWQTAWELIRVNVDAAVQLSLAFLTKMRARNAGHIINVGSISGSIPSQGIAVYGATKSFLDNFTTALYRELAGSRVRVSIVRAGPVRTEFGAAALAKPRGGHVPTEHMGVSADRVADAIWELLLHPRRVVYIPGWLRIVPWVEMSFGYIIDKFGPLLLRRQRETH
jgi:short-subunit dehydrogenase